MTENGKLVYAFQKSVNSITASNYSNKCVYTCTAKIIYDCKKYISL